MKRKAWMLWGFGGLVAAGASFVIFVWIPAVRFGDALGAQVSRAFSEPTPESAERRNAALAMLEDFAWNYPPAVLLCTDGSAEAFVCGDEPVGGLEVRRLEPPDAELFALRANPRGPGFALIANSVKPINGVRDGDPRFELWLREDAAGPWRKCTHNREFKSACGWMHSGQGVLYAELPEPDPDDVDDEGEALPPRTRILAYDIPTEGIRPYSKLASFDMVYALTDETESGVYCEGRIRGRCGIWKVVPGAEPRLVLPFGSAPTLAPDGRTILYVRASDGRTWPAWKSASVDLLRLAPDRGGDAVEVVRPTIAMPVRSIVPLGSSKLALVSRALTLPGDARDLSLTVVDL